MDKKIKVINTDLRYFIAKFIEDSIEFTSAQYQESREKTNLLDNSFDIGKVLKTLRDRSKHLKNVSESLMTKSRSLIASLNLYDSEIACENQQQIKTLAFVTGSLGIIIASIAIFLSTR